MKEKAINNKELLAFGRSLKKARIDAGYNSLSSAIVGIKKLSASSSLSRATLNLMENGNISDINTDFLKILCRAFSLDYEQKLKEYLSIRYSLSKSFFSTGEIVKKASKDTLLIGDSSESEADIEIISIDKFKKLQRDLPSGSIVWVSVVNFIDDSTFFDLVLANIKKGIRYYYYIPEESELKYRHFVSMLSKELNLHPDEIDNVKCFFVKRGVSEFPIVAVLFLSPSNVLDGFVGLSSGDRIDYFLKADMLLSWRLYQSFLMAFSLSLDPEILARRKKIDFDLKNVKEIKGFPVLMGSLGV
jgi:hypothetical protein